MYPAGSCKCVHCNERFVTDPRNRWHQEYCGRRECRQASKAASQARWRGKPENADYDQANAKNAVRVRAWQKAHPGYWKQGRKKRAVVLRDLLIAQDAGKQKDVNQDVSPVLRDLSQVQVPLILGLIAHLGDLSYAEDIAVMANRFVARGHALMGQVPSSDANPKTNPLR
jgi:hypothetical protein